MNLIAMWLFFAGVAAVLCIAALRRQWQIREEIELFAAAMLLLAVVVYWWMGVWHDFQP
jgi:hypothetical protein